MRKVVGGGTGGVISLLVQEVRSKRTHCGVQLQCGSVEVHCSMTLRRSDVVRGACGKNPIQTLWYREARHYSMHGSEIIQVELEVKMLK